MNRTTMMRHVVEGVVEDLALMPPFSVREFADAVCRRWHVEVDLLPFTQGDHDALQLGTTGWSCFAGDAFQIHYFSGGSVAQQDYIIYHELGHLVLRHAVPGNNSHCHRWWGDQTEAELNAEAFAELMVELAVLGAENGDRRVASSCGTDDPYVHFLSAQEL